MQKECARKEIRTFRPRKLEDQIQDFHASSSLPHAQRQALLLEALTHGAHYVGALAAEALGECADTQAADRMTEQIARLNEDGLRSDPGCHIRAHLAFALGRLQHFPAADALRIGIRIVQIEAAGGVPFDTGAHLRANCALALGQLRSLESIREIALLLFDRAGYEGQVADPLVKAEPRKAAARALALTGSAQARLPLTLRLAFPGNEIPDVLQECMEALVALEDPDAVEILTPYLRQSNSSLAAYAGLMIARTQAPDATRLLVEMIPTLTGDMLRAIIIALSTLRSPEAFAALQALAQDKREEVRLAARDVLPTDRADRCG